MPITNPNTARLIHKAAKDVQLKRMKKERCGNLKTIQAYIHHVYMEKKWEKRCKDARI